MSAEGAKFNLTVYNLPEDAQRLAVNLSGEKIDNIQVTDALRDADGNITLEIGSTAYPFAALSQPGEHTVRVTYEDGAGGGWPQIGEIASLTVKPATPVLSGSEDSIAEGEDYTLTWTDDVKNDYGVTYEYAFLEETTGAYGEWTAVAEKTVTIKADTFPNGEAFTVGVRAKSNGVYSDIATVHVTVQGLTVTVDPETAYYTGSAQTITVTVDGLGQAYRNETASLFFNGSATAMTSGTVSASGSVSLLVVTNSAAGMYPF